MKEDTLIQLPNGNWVRRSEVRSISAYDYSDRSQGGFIAPRIVITTNGFQSVTEYATFEKALEVRDEFAKLVNG